MLVRRSLSAATVVRRIRKHGRTLQQRLLKVPCPRPRVDEAPPGTVKLASPPSWVTHMDDKGKLLIRLSRWTRAPCLRAKVYTSTPSMHTHDCFSFATCTMTNNPIHELCFAPMCNLASAMHVNVRTVKVALHVRERTWD